jgi:ABC-type transport system involved in multi-copper enzyme maturation permease subunit
MSDAALGTHLRRALARLPWLDEALAQREWRRTLRQMTTGRWPALFTLLVLALWLPALTTAGYSSGAMRGWRWPFASLGIAICLCSLCAAYLRASQMWYAELRSRSLETWLLSLQRAVPLAATVVLSAALSTVLISLPLLALLVMIAAQSGVPPETVVGILTFDLIAVLTAAATGSALFFVQLKAYAPRAALMGVASFAALLAVLWLRVEYVEAGWAGPWDRHVSRFGFALFFLTPLPHLLGLTASGLWRTTFMSRLGFFLPAGVTTTLLAVLYLAAAAYGLWLAARGFQLLRDDPERLEHRPEVVEGNEELGREFYWTGFRNPIWTREIRTRLRSREAVECILFASLAIAGAGFFPLFSAGGELGDPLQTANLAREVFFWLTMTLGVFVTLITPGLTAEAITLERERGTLELLLISPLRPREILHGKLLGAISILALLLSPSLPLFAMCTVFHGASVGQVLGVYAVLGFHLALCAYFGVTASAIHTQMIYAKCQAYCLSLLAGLGSLWILSGIATPIATGRQGLVGIWIMAQLLFIVGLFVMAVLWGHATERLQYSEVE